MREIFIAWNGKTGNDFSLNVAGEMRGKHHTTPSAILKTDGFTLNCLYGLIPFFICGFVLKKEISYFLFCVRDVVIFLYL